jgi:hypothetical protein
VNIKTRVPFKDKTPKAGCNEERLRDLQTEEAPLLLTSTDPQPDAPTIRNKNENL